MSAFTWTRVLLLFLGCALLVGIWIIRKHDVAEAETEKLRAIIQKIEASIEMPAGADPLKAYRRYYGWEELNGRRVVEGHFLLEDGADQSEAAEKVPGLDRAYIWREQFLPRIYDGGCNMVTVYFDIEADALVRLKQRDSEETGLGLCNGFA